MMNMENEHRYEKTEEEKRAVLVFSPETKETVDSLLALPHTESEEEFDVIRSVN